jgi:hypothetical protein
MGSACSTHGKMTACRILVGEPKGTSPAGRIDVEGKYN